MVKAGALYASRTKTKTILKRESREKKGGEEQKRRQGTNV
jgi:hypothetical protein